MNSTTKKLLELNHNNNTIFYCGGEETLRISRAGFWVRGVRVPADDQEAKQVYNAFKSWLSYQGLTHDYR